MKKSISNLTTSLNHLFVFWNKNKNLPNSSIHNLKKKILISQIKYVYIMQESLTINFNDSGLQEGLLKNWVWTFCQFNFENRCDSLPNFNMSLQTWKALDPV